MNNRLLIPLAAVAVACAVLFMRWVEKDPDPAPSTPGSALAANPRPLETPTVATTAPTTAVLDTGHMQPTTPAAPQALVPEKPAMPVSATFRRIPRGEGKFQGSISNTSMDPLDVTVLVGGPKSRTPTQIQLSLAPGASQLIGTDDGLQLGIGDTLLLQNPDYRDFRIEIH